MPSPCRSRRRAAARPPAPVLASLLAALAVVPGARAAAQGAGATVPVAPVAAADPGPYARALRLVETGQGSAGRALVDSLVDAAPPTSPARAEALWWRATLAADAPTRSATTARWCTRHPASPRAADAALRLAQLALLRGQPGQARPSCSACCAPTPRRRRAGAPTTGSPAPAPRSATPRAPAPRSARPRRAPSPATTSSRASPSSGGSCRSARRVGRPGAGRAGAPIDGPAVGGARRLARAVGRRAIGAPRRARPAAPPPRAPAAAGPRYAVQVAAYDARGEAEASVRRLTARGLAAYVSAEAPPYRVRVGRHATRADAAAEQRRLAEQGMRGFVAVEPATPAGAPR
jgi:hypothetical protein